MKLTGKSLKEFALKVPDEAIIESCQYYNGWTENVKLRATLEVPEETEDAS